MLMMTLTFRHPSAAVGLAQRFAIQGDPVTRESPPLSQPRQHHLLQGRGFEHGKDPVDRVMGGNAVRSLQKGTQEGLVAFPPGRYLPKIITPRQHPTEAQNDNIHQGGLEVLPLAARSGSLPNRNQKRR